MFTCENCHRPFKAQSSLLRHISHRETCKAQYGQERLEDFKKASRLISKRKWRKSHSAESKSKYKRDKESGSGKKAKQCYVTVNRKRTLQGKSLTLLYNIIYFEAEEEIVEKLQQPAYDAVFDFAYDTAIDRTMNSEDYIEIFYSNDNGFYYVENGLWERGIKEGIDIGLELEKAFDILFNRFLKDIINKAMDTWISKRTFEIYQKCWRQGERRVFSNFFEDFKKNIFVTFKSEAIDFAFSEFDEMNMNCSDIEEELDRIYRVKIDQLVEESSKNSDFSRDVYKTVYDMMYRQAIMWVKLNKPFTD